ncbi:MAG: RNA polymerase sigma-70 factor (ECF subfamily) [Bacteroidia bacterium]|jgi:RNA polymerase sigma-70 factor (ECF subfamily)
MPASEEIIQRLQKKDITAFEMVFKQYYAELCGFANKYVQNPEVAEELVQDMFCGLWDKMERISIQTNLKSYLYSGIRNAAFNYFKHQKVVDKYEQFASVNSPISEEASKTLEVKELQQSILKAMAVLPDKCRQVFEMSRNEHMKYREIADELNISIKTVEIHMGKALKILRKELGSYLPLALIIWSHLINK